VVRRRNAVDIAIYAFLTLIAIVCLLPIWHVVAVSLSAGGPASAGKVTFWPKGLNIEGYRYIVDDSQFLRAFWMSIKRVVLGTALNMTLTVLMAFALSRSAKEFRFRNYYMWFLIFLLLFSGGLIPLYMVVRQLQLLDTIWALVLPGAVPIFNVILLMNFFRGIPKELEEAAVIDGATPFRVLWEVFLPLSLPALATVGLFSMVGHWNAFFDGLIYMQSPDKYPLQTYIQQLVVLPPTDMDPAARSELLRSQTFNKAVLDAAKLVVAMVPILLVYPFLQRFFIHGLTIGSLKE
jgi:ABC-type glycerol-3-phosphate transport system permease component